ncbi:MAG: cysteine--tRNA ligase [Bacteroidales bacterium]
MATELHIYNSLTRKKETFRPLNPPFTGLYVCGPTVYGDAHLGHARPAVTFDLVFRYLRHLGYKVRYVRNITDVGHLESDADEGEDKIAKKARIEQLEPMEVVQYYSDRYHADMEKMHVLKPSIEPRASGHIIEQIEMVKAILEAGFAYEINGSVYFDVQKYNQQFHYGKLSGRSVEEMLSSTRDLDGQEEKRHPADFALWKKATPAHIMRWPSPWGEGFPGWHLECSAMSARYLGETFDIHGGGMDLLFPHHECEIAQSNATFGKDSAQYWMHNNMITIEGQKMGKSLGNFITLREFFNGNHQKLERAFHPLTIRFFILQAHYRSTLDFSNEALEAAEKGLKRLWQAMDTLNNLPAGNASDTDVASLADKCYAALNDDFNSPVTLSYLFDTIRTINAVKDGHESLTQESIDNLKQVFKTFVIDIFGLGEPENGPSDNDQELINGLMSILLDIRQQARKNKDWDTADKLRDSLQKLNITVKDGKDGASWEITK